MAACTFMGIRYPMDRSRTPSLLPRASAKLAFFSQIPHLADLGPEVLARLAARTSQQNLDRRDRLWNQGDEVTHLYWVRSGIFREVLQVSPGRECVLDFYGRLELFGEACALQLASDKVVARTTTAIAHEESTIYALAVQEIAPLLASAPLLGLKLAALSAERRVKREVRLAQHIFRSAQARIASALLDLGEIFGVRDSRGVIINLRLTHRDLAGLAGASRETASLALLDWRREGWLLVEGKRVVLLDVERLLAISRDETAHKAIPLAAEER